MNYYLTVLKKYAEFNGRARRSEYWYFVLFNMLIAFGLGFIAGATGSMFINYLYLLYCLAVLIPGLAVAIRRMHDVNKSGWFILIPIYNLILACTPGTAGPNQYGSDPKRPEFDDFLSESKEPGQPA